MKEIGAAEFKAKCLRILDELGPDGIIVTKHGKPVAHVRPVPARSADLLGSLEGKITIEGDILSTGAEWDAHG